MTDNAAGAIYNLLIHPGLFLHMWLLTALILEGQLVLVSRLPPLLVTSVFTFLLTAVGVGTLLSSLLVDFL